MTVHQLQQKTHEDRAEEILLFLNAKAGKRFRKCNPKGEFTAQYRKILLRLQEGYDYQDMKSIIAMLCRKWKDDPKMADYLTPDTMFGPEKIEKYLGMLG